MKKLDGSELTPTERAKATLGLIDRIRPYIHITITTQAVSRNLI